MGSKSGQDALSQFEWLIMNQIWEQGKQSARQVMESLPAENQRAYTTIQTYLERLVEKQFLEKEKIGLVNFYSPLVQRDKVVKGATNSFVERVFRGSESSLAAYLIRNHKLSSQELDEIRALLEEDHD